MSGIEATIAQVSIAVDLGSGPPGAKGDPGANVLAVGLFSAISGVAVPNGTDLIQTSGYSVIGTGAARYRVGAIGAPAAAETRFSTNTLNGRPVYLAEPAPASTMVGVLADGSDQTAALVAILADLASDGFSGTLSVPAGVSIDLATVRASVPAGIQLRDERPLGSSAFERDTARKPALLYGGDAVPGIRSRPAFIEQFLTGFAGRGMIDNEANSLATEQVTTEARAAGADTVPVSDLTDFDAGGHITVLHDNGRYATYFITAIGSTVAVAPPLRYALASGQPVERTWYNRAHPGKFYMRELAQRIAHSTEIEAAMPDNERIAFANYRSDPFAGADVLTPLGTATVEEKDAANLGETGTVASIVRYPYRTHAINIAANGDGATTPFFEIDRPGPFIAKVALMCRLSTAEILIDVIDPDGVVVGAFNVPTGQALLVPQIYTFRGHTRGTTSLRFRIRAVSGVGAASYIGLYQVDAFSAPEFVGPIISKRDATIVCLGDSWVAGDLINTAEREPITQQLALELPFARIINSGIGGDDIVEMSARFDDDVAAYDPDYVVVCTGTNECYSLLSGIFDPNSLEEFRNRYTLLIDRIVAIGARPIIIGVPALAQADPDAPSIGEFVLNDRARGYSRYFWQTLTRAPTLA